MQIRGGGFAMQMRVIFWRKSWNVGMYFLTAFSHSTAGNYDLLPLPQRDCRVITGVNVYFLVYDSPFHFVAKDQGEEGYDTKFH